MANAIAHVVFLRFQGGVPQNILVAKTVALDEMMQPSFKIYAHQINKEMIPRDPLPPTKTSGLRVGTPAITTRGFKENDCKQVAKMILAIIHHPDDPSVAKKVSQEAHQLTSTHPNED